MNKHEYETAHCRSKVAKLTGLLGLCLVGFLLSVPLSLAQTGQGTVTGTVVDLSQAIVPKADVTLTNVATGVATRGQSSDVGIFYFGAVPIGPYRIAVSKVGFEQWVGTFTLFVGQNAVVNPALKMGSTTTVVEVTGAAAPIETQSGSVADVKESNQIRDLPLNGRQVGGLLDLTAGVESGSSSARVNGMKVGSLDFNLDGASMLDRFGGGMVRVEPGIETIQEFRVETVGSDARFDQPATVIMATRSGTNQLHGAGYEYLRDNSVIGATRLRTDPVGSDFQLPLLIRNEFGGYLSGPVYIPHVYNGKNKSFWFFDYEGLRSRQRASPLLPYVPTAAMWEGDLSNAVDTSNPCTVNATTCPTGSNPITIYDPTTTNPTTFARTPFPNNQIPATTDPTALELKSLTALPTNSNNPYIASNFTSTYPQVSTIGNYTAKWDQNLSDKDRLSVRYTRSSNLNAIEGGYYAEPVNTNSGIGTSATQSQTTNVAVNYNRTISPNWLNELLVGVLRTPSHQGTLADFTNWDSKLGLSNPFGATGWPTIYAYEDNSQFGWDSDNREQENLTSETIEDNVTWTHSKHTFQFGFRGRREQNNIAQIQQAQGVDMWYPAWTTLFDNPDMTTFPDTGSGFAEMLLGLPVYLSNEYNRGYFYFRQTELGMYVNDKIKISPRLTLNLGLRWDYWTPYSEARNRLVLPYEPDQKFEVITPGNVTMSQLNAPPAQLAAFSSIGLTWATANSVGYPSALFVEPHHDFGPRLGAAYQINHNTVLRGSYGAYYVPDPLAFLLEALRINVPLNFNYSNDAVMNTNVPGGANGPYMYEYPYISAPAASDYLPAKTVTINSADAAPTEGNSAVSWDGKNWRDSHVQTWNLTLEHELPMHTGLRLSYIGTYGGSLEQQYALNDPEPDYNYAVRTGLQPPSDSNQLRGVPQWNGYNTNHTGYSRDHSFQAEVHRTFSNGASFQAFYTFTRQLTTTDPNGFTDGNTSLNGGGGGAPVPESFEVLGEPNLTYAQREKLVYFNSTSIPPHRVTFNGIYDLPFGKGKYFARNASTPLNYLIGGWQVATIGTWNSG